MRKKITFFISLMVVTLLFTACKPTQIHNRNFFSHDKPDSTHTRIWQDYQLRIHKRDRLSIVISALNPQSAAIFNAGSGSGGQGATQGYPVDEQGNILIPQLGLIHVEGYTKFELRDTLMNRLKKYLTDPVVMIEFANLKVTVMGEVGRQGPLPLNDSRVTLLEALGEAGNISTTGRRDSILVIREENNVRKFGYVNLLSNDAFKSDFFMLQQNDIVYVPMVKSRATARDTGDGTFLERTLPYISVLTSITSLVWLIYSITR
jgi:protein involved in polysaccharide export with SLBB domain